MDLKSKLSDGSYKLTGQRQAVLDVLMANKDEHLSADEVHKCWGKGQSHRDCHGLQVFGIAGETQAGPPDQPRRWLHPLPGP